MKSTDIDWRSGRVTYWDLDTLDPSRPFTDQIWELDEDLAQVAFDGDLLIDVSWLPAYSADGSFVVVLVKGGDWDAPLMRQRCRSVPNLILALRRAIDMAEHRDRGLA